MSSCKWHIMTIKWLLNKHYPTQKKAQAIFHRSLQNTFTWKSFSRKSASHVWILSYSYIKNTVISVRVVSGPYQARPNMANTIQDNLTNKSCRVHDLLWTHFVLMCVYYLCKRDFAPLEMRASLIWTMNFSPTQSCYLKPWPRYESTVHPKTVFGSSALFLKGSACDRYVSVPILHKQMIRYYVTLPLNVLNQQNENI